jgi:hypothetical protein
MNTFFGRELYIRLAQDEGAFVCTTRYGKIYTKAKKFLLQGPAADVDENSEPVRKKRRTSSLSLLQPDTGDPDDE